MVKIEGEKGKKGERQGRRVKKKEEIHGRKVDKRGNIRKK